MATLVAAAPIHTSAQAPETAGMVGEVKRGRGRVEVKPAGAADWRPARPLGALRSGDQLRTTRVGACSTRSPRRRTSPPSTRLSAPSTTAPGRQQATTASQEAQLLWDGGRPAAPASAPR